MSDPVKSPPSKRPKKGGIVEPLSLLSKSPDPIPPTHSPTKSPTNREASPPASPLIGAWDHTSRKYSFPKNKIKVLLLEGISAISVDLMRREGFAVESLAGALGESDLIAKIGDVHLIGVRSKTKLTKAVLSAAKRLKAVGCFCIGTDQTDLPCAESLGIAVFNSPFSNSRSVAELAMSHIIALSRRVPEHVLNMHNRVWNKTADRCHEIRGKTLGIIGYGHIGTQLGILAEAMGMKVVFYDVATIMPLGMAQPMNSLNDLLLIADVVSLHVPETDQTIGLIGKPQLQLMKKGALLLNLSRGKVADQAAVREAIDSGHLSGFACDVFPSEPEKNGPLPADIPMILAGARNTILTPHVGGSTLEAQEAIGREVAYKLINFMNTGSSEGAVNFPNITPPAIRPGQHRLLHVHRNVPGVLMAVNNEMAKVGNITYQQLVTTPHIGYLIVDVEAKFGDELRVLLKQMTTTIKVRILY